jgi:ribosomal protein S18 acetylase RimI-like enzyme
LISGRVYRRFRVDGKTVVLRVMRWDDTYKLLAFINGLADDKEKGRFPEVFKGFERKVGRDEEADWVASKKVQIENGDMVSVLAEVNKRIVANGEITRGHYAETRHHGRLALTVMAAYRGIGIGREMLKVLLSEARRLGLKNVEVDFLSTNQVAVQTYQRAGFREVGGIPGKVHRKRKFLDSLVMAREI